MNYVIIGESRCGKSTLASLICSSIVGYSKISCDYLIMAFEKTLPQTKIDFSRKGESLQNFSDFVVQYFNNCIYCDGGIDVNYVLEGGGLSFDAILKLNQMPNVKVICLGKTKLTAKEFYKDTRKFEKSLKTGGWTKRLNDQTLLNYCESWINSSKINQELCNKNNILFIDTSYNQMSILQDIVNKIKHKKNNPN